MININQQLRQAMLDNIKQKQDANSLLFIKDEEVHCRFDSIQIQPKVDTIEITLFWKGDEVHRFTEPYYFGQMCTLTGLTGSMAMKLL